MPKTKCLRTFNKPETENNFKETIISKILTNNAQQQLFSIL